MARPPLDPRGEIVSMSAVAGQSRVRRAGRPDEDAARRREHLRRAYAVWLRSFIADQQIDPGWRGEIANEHWRLFRAGYLACLNGDGEDVALEDHEAWTERVMAMPAGRGLRIIDTEEGPLPLLPGTMFLTDAEELPRPDRCGMGAYRAADPAGQARRRQTARRYPRGDQRRDVHSEHRLPVARAAQGFAAQKHRA